MAIRQTLCRCFKNHMNKSRLTRQPHTINRKPGNRRANPIKAQHNYTAKSNALYRSEQRHPSTQETTVRERKKNPTEREMRNFQVRLKEPE
jgi:hypothetical protein